MPGQRVRRNPIEVRKVINHRGEPAWAWHCDDHPRARGYHNQQRWSDHYRASRGMEPDAHPWQRAQFGAIRHYHRYHSKCTCSVPASHTTAPRQGT